MAKRLTPEEKIVQIVNKRNLTPLELDNLLKGIEKSSKPSRSYNHYMGSKPFKIGIISDTHIGQENFKPELLKYAGNVFRSEKVSAVYHAGDIIEGMSGRDGQVYEMTHLGFQNQIDYTAELFKKGFKGLDIFGINGNHDAWHKRKGNAGADVSKTLSSLVDRYTHLGDDEADINLGSNIKMKLIHPGDGTAYAISYKLQKRIESLDGGKKPNILVEGHYHKALFMFLRNVHGIEAGTFCGQTGWMRSKNIQAHVGFWVLGVQPMKRGSKGIASLNAKFYPSYEV